MTHLPVDCCRRTTPTNVTMKPKNRTVLQNLESWSLDSLIDLRLMARRLELMGDELPGEFDKARAAVAACLKPIEGLQNEVNALYESDALATVHTRAVPLSEGEISQLLTLNRRLKDVASHLLSVAGDVTPRLKAKVADPDDPMFDYEIEARIDYQLRQDDPDFDEDDDNYLSTRTEYLTRLSGLEEEDFTEPYLPAALRAEPHCWLFHDLYDHSYGPESPRLSFQDCLRIGHIFVDIQVWQQYVFDAQGERKRPANPS